jgi:hypothetical protein
VCEAAPACTTSHASSLGRFNFSISPALSPTSSGAGRAHTFTQPQRCAPIYGLTARGLYQAMCVQTLAISISPLESKVQSTHLPRRTRTFHFHIRKTDGAVDTDLKREKGDDENNSGSLSTLSLDFRDFSSALAM